MNRYANVFPWVVVGLFALWAAAKMTPRKETYKDFDLTAFGATPVLDGGRLKPLDTIARINMLHISGRSEFEDLNEDTRPAIQWLLEVMAAKDANESPVADYKVFRVDNEQLLAELGLEYRPGSYRYSWNELRKVADKFDRVFKAAQVKERKKDNGEKVAEEERDIFHGKVIELGKRLRAYERLANRDTLTVVPKKAGSKEWQTLADVDEAIAESLGDGSGVSFKDRETDRAYRELVEDLRSRGMNIEKLPPQAKQSLQAQAEMQAKRPSMKFGESKRQDFAVALAKLRAEVAKGDAPAEATELLARMQERGTGEGSFTGVPLAAADFGAILTAFRENRPAAFAAAVADYKAEHVYPLNPELRDTTAFELAFNKAYPFYYAAFFYIFAGVFSACGWLGWSEPLRRAGFLLAVVALFITMVGLLGRMYMMDRPLVFVTNLYSSALLIGAGAVAACLYVERLFQNGVGLCVGTTLGATTVKIAHHLSTDGSDTLGTLVAVLDTNFWLASHVTTVTLGYAATYVAGLFAAVYILWGLFGTTLTKEKHVAIGNMIYGTTCFATMLSFVGTVLGGIWADQSWGRFWGWDPKENGAVLIVIWNSLILHARWGGIVRQRGMAVLAVAGVMVTTWSWFGTNQLGVGLHNYGFNKSLADGCKWTWIACMAVIGIGCIPLQYWRSFAETGQPRPEFAVNSSNVAPPGAPPKPPTPPTAETQPRPGSGKGNKGKRR